MRCDSLLPRDAAGDVAGVEGEELQGLVGQVQAGVAGRGGQGVLLEAEVAEDAGGEARADGGDPGRARRQVDGGEEALSVFPNALELLLIVVILPSGHPQQQGLSF